VVVGEDDIVDVQRHQRIGAGGRGRLEAEAGEPGLIRHEAGHASLKRRETGDRDAHEVGEEAAHGGDRGGDLLAACGPVGMPVDLPGMDRVGGDE